MWSSGAARWKAPAWAGFLVGRVWLSDLGLKLSRVHPAHRRRRRDERILPRRSPLCRRSGLPDLRGGVQDSGGPARFRPSHGEACRSPYTFGTREFGESKLDLAVSLEYLYLVLDKLIGGFVPTCIPAIYTLVGAAGVILHLSILPIPVSRGPRRVPNFTDRGHSRRHDFQFPAEQSGDLPGRPVARNAVVYRLADVLRGMHDRISRKPDRLRANAGGGSAVDFWLDLPAWSSVRPGTPASLALLHGAAAGVHDHSSSKYPFFPTFCARVEPIWITTPSAS